MTPTEPTYDDPNREAVGVDPIWTGADDETPDGGEGGEGETQTVTEPDPENEE